MRNGPVFYRRFSLTGAVLNVGLLDGLGMGLLGWWHYECDDDYGSFPKMPCVSLAPVSWLHFWNVAAKCGGFSLSHVFSKTAAVLFLNLGPLNSMFFFTSHVFQQRKRPGSCILGEPQVSCHVDDNDNKNKYIYIHIPWCSPIVSGKISPVKMTGWFLWLGLSLNYSIWFKN
jgi:hypothetical protein